MSWGRRPRMLWIVLGLAVGILLGALVVRRPAQPLTAERLAEAREKWRSAAVTDYSLEIRTEGSAGALHEVEVRRGEVTAMTIGGAPASKSAWQYWSVDGLFGFLETELANAVDARRTYGVEPDSVVLRARFDRDHGAPELFLRHVMGTRQSIEWEITRFE
ncbi:MAG: DUF6174 domain-containing protein [Acidobacteria bacterium]|nr:DUF6174 domain-containing protein [Acidobacteriota bacterium]